MTLVEKVLLEEVVNNSDIDISTPADITILSENHKYTGYTKYELNFKLRIRKKNKAQDTTRDKYTSSNSDRHIKKTDIKKVPIEKPRKKYTYREIALAERPPLYPEDIEMTDIEFMEIIAGTGLSQKGIKYKRESYIICMNKFLDNLYRPR
jgi:hypothetical protein